MTYDFKLSCTLPANPQAVCDAWLDSAAHSPMTGAGAKIAKRVGGETKGRPAAKPKRT